MKNITVTVDDELYRRARVRAAEKGTTVSAVVKDALRNFSAEETEAEERSRRLEALYRRADAEVAKGGALPVEPGWRNRMYDERFDNSVLGRELKNRQP